MRCRFFKSHTTMQIDGKDILQITLGNNVIYTRKVKLGDSLTAFTSQFTVTGGIVTKIDYDAYWLNGIKFPFSFCKFYHA